MREKREYSTKSEYEKPNKFAENPPKRRKIGKKERENKQNVHKYLCMGFEKVLTYKVARDKVDMLVRGRPFLLPTKGNTSPAMGEHIR